MQCGELFKNAWKKKRMKKADKESFIKVFDNMPFDKMIWHLKGYQNINPRSSQTVIEEDKERLKILTKLIKTRYKYGQRTGLFDMNSREALIGDRVFFYNTEGERKEHIISWDDLNKCLTFGNMPYLTIMESGFYQSSINGKKHLDFWIIN